MFALLYPISESVASPGEFLYRGNFCTTASIAARSSDLGTPIFSNGFLGVTSTTAFDRIQVTTGATTNAPYQFYDNIQLVNSVGTSVPEAGTLAPLLPALGMIGAIIVRRNK